MDSSASSEVSYDKRCWRESARNQSYRLSHNSRKAWTGRGASSYWPSCRLLELECSESLDWRPPGRPEHWWIWGDRPWFEERSSPSSTSNWSALLERRTRYSSVCKYRKLYRITGSLSIVQSSRHCWSADSDCAWRGAWQHNWDESAVKEASTDLQRGLQPLIVESQRLTGSRRVDLKRVTWSSTIALWCCLRIAVLELVHLYHSVSWFDIASEHMHCQWFGWNP